MAILLKIAIVVSAEILLAVGFHFFSPQYLRLKKIDFRSIGKGICERTLLTVALLNGLPHVLTLFGALKLGTRLKRRDVENNAADEARYNDYFLVGNFISVLVCIFYYNMFIYNET